MNPHTVPIINGMAMSYSKFNGKKADILFAPWDNALLSVDVRTESGTLAVVIAKDNDRDNPISRWDNLPTTQLTFPLPGSGPYYVWLEAKDHKGSYRIEVIPGQ